MYWSRSCICKICETKDCCKTEAELISVSDGLSQVIWTIDFLKAQGYQGFEVIVYQDNKSTIHLIKKGMSTSDRTRHINVRYYFIKQFVDKGIVKVEYCPTREMIADILTKPLYGSLFRELKAKLLNWHD